MSIKKQIGEAFEKGFAVPKTATESKQCHFVRELYTVSEELRKIEIPTDKDDLNLYNAAMDSIVAIANQLFRTNVTRGKLIDLGDYISALTKQLLGEEDGGKYSFNELMSFAIPQAPISFNVSTDPNVNIRAKDAAKSQKTVSVFPFMNK